MMLITKEIKDRLPKLYATEGTPVEEKIVQAKWFDPYGSAYWLLVEGEEQQNGDWLLFGYAELLPGCGEWGYFSKREIEGLNSFGAPRIERDKWHEPVPFARFEGRYAH